MADCWLADMTEALFLGMTAPWIEVKDGQWKLRLDVTGFKGLSGDHGGGNLGRYFVGLCEHVGIITEKGSKVLYTYL